MSNEFIEIQENLFDYFEKVDNKTLAEFIDVFVYLNSTDNTKISKLADEFLKDNGLTESYINYVEDTKNPREYFSRATMSQRSIIQQINSGLLSLAFRRFNNEVTKPKPKSSPIIKLNRREKDDLYRVIEDCERRNNDLMDDESATKEMFDKDEANELIKERKRFKKLFTKVLNLIK
jgi:hypothetical protein